MATLPTEFADLEPYADWCLEFEHERYAKRLVELDGRDAGVLRRRVPAARGGDGVPRPAPSSTRCPTTPRHLLWLCYSLVNVSFPIEVWRQPRVPDSGAARMDVVVEPAV